MKTGYNQKYIIILSYSYHIIIIIVIMYDIILIKEYKNVNFNETSAWVRLQSAVSVSTSVFSSFTASMVKNLRFHVSVSIKSSVFFRSTPKCFCWKEWSGASSNLWREHFFYQFLLECLCWARLTEPVISSPQRHRPVSVHAVRPCKYSVKSVLMQPPAFLMKAQVDLRQWETGKIDPRSNFWLCAAPECRWASFNI